MWVPFLVGAGVAEALAAEVTGCFVIVAPDLALDLDDFDRLEVGLLGSSSLASVLFAPSGFW
jgi:hypothetical protein